MQIGFVLSNTLSSGMDGVQTSSFRSTHDATAGLAAI
jgi:hypothetical protein